MVDLRPATTGPGDPPTLPRPAPAPARAAPQQGVKACFIFNPHSGSNRGSTRNWDRARACIAREGWDATLVATEGPRHATTLARRAVDGGCTLVVALGGDGTMNEVATALVDTPATFGLVPCGSGNGLGRHLGISRRNAFAVLATGVPLAIDTGFVNRDPFFCVAGTGFEAVVASQFATLTARGFAGYLRTGLRVWRHHRPERYTIHHAGGRAQLAGFTLAIANAAQYGNHAFIAPGASVRDGLLDLTVIPPLALPRALPLLWRLFHGSLDRLPAVTRLRGERFVVEREHPGWIHTDGEPRAGVSRLEISLRPRSLRLMAPAPATPATAPAPPAASS